MKRASIFLVFCLLLTATFALADDIVYVTYCRNGTPATLEALKFVRGGPAAPYVLQDTAVLVLAKTCGVTDIQHQGANRLHVYYTDAVGSKIRIVRETLDKATFEFLAGERKAFPANLGNHLNFDTNDVQSIGLRAPANKLLHSKAINSSGNLAGPFKPRGRTPFTPFNSHISNGAPFLTSSLWFDSASGRVGITFQNLVAPTNSRSFLFTNRVFAHDTTVSFPRPNSNSSSNAPAEDDEVDFWTVIYEFVGAVVEGTPNLAPGFAPFIRKIQRSDFTPVGNVVRLDKNRANPSTSSITFNGIAIDPLGTLIAYVRHKAPCGSNELVVQTFDPIKGRKIGKAKVGKPCTNTFIIFGLSVLNEAFLNGVTPD